MTPNEVFSWIGVAFIGCLFLFFLAFLLGFLVVLYRENIRERG